MATTGIICTPVEPVPMTPTRLPVKSKPAAGQRLVYSDGAGEGVHSCDVRFQRHREDARRRHDERRDECLDLLRISSVHSAAVLVERHRDDVGVQANVAPQVQPIGDELR